MKSNEQQFIQTIQSLINLPMGIFENQESIIKPEDYYNFKDIPKNSLLVIDSQYLSIINEVTKTNELKFMIKHHNKHVPDYQYIEELKNEINEFLYYNQTKEEINVFIVGHKLWKIYESIIDVIHVTSVNSLNSQDINDFWNELNVLGFEKSITKHITGKEIIDDDSEVVSPSKDYIILERLQSNV